MRSQARTRAVEAGAQAGVTKVSQEVSLDKKVTLHHTPYTILHTLHTIHPRPYTLHLTLYTLHHTPYGKVLPILPPGITIHGVGLGF